MNQKLNFLRKPFHQLRFLRPSFNFSNFYVDSSAHHSFLSQNSFPYHNQIISGHPINTAFKNPHSNQTVVVGGGVVGVSSALYLCQNTTDNVVLVEKLPAVGQETSNANGGIYGLEYNIIWVSREIKSHYWRSLVQRDYPFKFRLKALLDKSMIRWVFNMLLSVVKDQENLDKLDDLAQLSGKEFAKLQQILPGNLYDVTAKGLLSLYATEEDYKKKLKFFEKKKGKGFNLIDIPAKDLVKLEPLLADSKENFARGMYYPIETNVETEKFTKAMLKHMQEKYSSRFKLLTETQANGFLFNVGRRDPELFAINTNNGAIKFDRVVVAAGLYCTDLLANLSINCPLAPVKGYTLSVPVKHFATGVKTIVSDEKKRMSFAQIGDIIRLAAFAEFAGRNKNVEEKRRKQIVALLEEKIGKFPEEAGNIWVGLRPVSPDDVPVIGKVKKFRNVFVNTGHGSKGTTLALGAARLLLESMGEIPGESLPLEAFKLERFY